MSKRQDDKKRSERSFGADDAVEALLGNADPRPVPPVTDEAAIRAAVHAEWDQLTGRRRRRRLLLTYGLAASVLVAMFLGLSMLRAPGDSAYGVRVATIEKQRGVIRVTGGDEEQRSVVPGFILSGQIVETGADSGLTLAWGRGGSLRLDANSLVQIESASRIRLVAGRIYYDSVSDPMARVAPQAGMARILVATPHGTLRHIGTQFMAGLVTNDELQVLVREGAVRLELDAVRETLVSGQQAHVTTDQQVLFSAVDGIGARWHWVEQLSPPIKLEGRSAHEALQWISRETGQPVTYRGDSAEQIARDFPLRGVHQLGQSEPSKALAAIVSIAGLEWRAENGAIIVSETDDNGA